MPQHYVISITKEGHPIISLSADSSYAFKPIPLQRWLDGDNAFKLQFPAERWRLIGYDIDLIFENWKAWGFLPEKKREEPEENIQFIDDDPYLSADRLDRYF